MARYIEVDKVIKLTWEETRYFDPINVLTEMREKIMAMPTADVRDNARGEWKATAIAEVRYKRLFECSNCSGYVTIDIREPYDFCPYCGSKNEFEQSVTKATWQ